MSADNHAFAADNAGLPVNSLSPVKDFAETLGSAKVNLLSADDAASVKQVSAHDMVQTQNSDLLSNEELSSGISEPPVAIELTTEAIFNGNGLPENGKTAPAEESIQTTHAGGRFLLEKGFGGLAPAHIANRSGSGIQSSQGLPNRLEAGVLPDAVARINESLQSIAKAIPEMLVGSKAEASGKAAGTVSIDPTRTPNNPAFLRSAQNLERSVMAQENVSMQHRPSARIKVADDSADKTAPGDLMRRSEMSKPPEGLNIGSLNHMLSTGKAQTSETELQIHSVNPRSVESKTDALSASPTESKPVLGQVELNQLVAGAVKSAYASSATRSSGETVQMTRNESPGAWIQQGELKVVNPDRTTADLLQVRVDSQPVNTASLMQRHVEQRLADQGSDTKRLQTEVAAALDTRISTESTDRALTAQAKTEPATSVMPKQAGAPVLGDPQSNSRQVDTAVQEQILRVMSRQALAQGRLTLQLNPHELGSLDIEFSTEKGEVQVAIVARETSTRDLLEASVARLRQSLQEGGVNVGQLDIRHGDRQSDEQGARESMRQSMATDASAPGSFSEEAVSSPHTDESGIHIYV